MPGRGWHSIRRKFATELKGREPERPVRARRLGGSPHDLGVLPAPDPDTMRVAQNRGHAALGSRRLKRAGTRNWHRPRAPGKPTAPQSRYMPCGASTW